MGVSKIDREIQIRNRIGNIKNNSQGCKMKIVEYRTVKDIVIEFIEYNIKIKTRYSEFLSGEIKNPLYKCNNGIGFIGVGKYSGKNYPIIYGRWSHMLKRCYNITFHIKYPTYKDCTVCEKWHNFQNFAKWHEENYYISDEKLELDKDFLIKGNKVYSPDTCIFVPKYINNILLNVKGVRGNYPLGVTYEKSTKKYIARTYKHGVRKFLGRFNTIEEAFKVYKINKEEYIKEIADKYKNKIPSKLYDAMYIYTVEITD